MPIHTRVLHACRSSNRLIIRTLFKQQNIHSKLCHSLISKMTEDLQTNVADANDSLNTVNEGRADVLLPKSVFYNPVQEFNRDLTISVISQFAKEHFQERKRKNAESDAQEATENIKSPETMMDDDENVILEAGKSYEDGIRIFEGLSASGLRSVRFGLEVPGVKEVIANDFDKHAVELIQKNIERNNLEGLVTASCGDAAMKMYENRSFKDRFDVIDLDPYGTPTPFLDSAVQAIRNGGLLCVTCTDTAVLCGNAGETCYSKYGAMSLKMKCCHEMALRIILQCIEAHANRYSRYTIPLLSVSVDFYVRVFVKVFKGQKRVKQSVSKLAMVYHCTGCGNFALQKIGIAIPTKGDNFMYQPGTSPPVGDRCPHCGFKHHFGGPIWAEAMHDVHFVQNVIDYVHENAAMFNTSNRILGMLNVIQEELPDVPLYYVIDNLCNIIHCQPIPLLQFRSAILNAGYRVSMSHAIRNSQKTDAPMDFIWDIFRTWVKENPVSEQRLLPGTPVAAILKKEPSHKVSFELHPDANPKSRKDGLLRWQFNPEKDWGPKPRAKRTDGTEMYNNKRKRKQGWKAKGTEEESYLKQFPCKRFKLGCCERGEDCKYRHDLDTGCKASNVETTETATDEMESLSDKPPHSTGGNVTS